MRRVVFIFILILLNISNLFAEKIDGPAYIRSQAQGVVMFILQNNIEVSCGVLDYGWYKVGVEISVTEEQWKMRIIHRGEVLKDKTGRIIGEVQEDCKIEPIMEKGKFHAKLTGYAYKTNIQNQTVPEEQLPVFLEKVKDSMSVNNFTPFFNQFNFIKKGIISKEEYTEYMIFESWVENKSPMDRIRFIFKNEMLLAIIVSREIALSNVKAFDLKIGRKLLLVQDIPENEIQLFLKQNEAAYLGIH